MFSYRQVLTEIKFHIIWNIHCKMMYTKVLLHVVKINLFQEDEVDGIDPIMRVWTLDKVKS